MGLVLAKNDNIRKLEIEINSLGVIQLLNEITPLVTFFLIAGH